MNIREIVRSCLREKKRGPNPAEKRLHTRCGCPLEAQNNPDKGVKKRAGAKSAEGPRNREHIPQKMITSSWGRQGVERRMGEESQDAGIIEAGLLRGQKPQQVEAATEVSKKT